MPRLDSSHQFAALYKHVPSPQVESRTCVRTSAMAYYLGIDGGGTKTRCVLADETTVLATSMTGGSNIVRLGEAQAREALHTAIRQVCATAKISPDQIRAICIGAAGAARPEIAAKIRSILAELIPDDLLRQRIEVVGDTVIALEAAFGAGPGVIAIAGTGSIVYGRDAAGRTGRAPEAGGSPSPTKAPATGSAAAPSPRSFAHDEGLETALTALVLQAWKLDHDRRTRAASQLDSAARFPAPVSDRPAGCRLREI